MAGVCLPLLRSISFRRTPFSTNARDLSITPDQSQMEDLPPPSSIPAGEARRRSLLFEVGSRIVIWPSWLAGPPCGQIPQSSSGSDSPPPCDWWDRATRQSTFAGLHSLKSGATRKDAETPATSVGSTYQRSSACSDTTLVPRFEASPRQCAAAFARTRVL